MYITPNKCEVDLIENTSKLSLFALTFSANSTKELVEAALQG
jgi:hypothetical protein